MLPPPSAGLQSAPRPAPPTSRGSVAALLEWGRTELSPASDSPRLDAEILLALILRRPRSSLIGFPERVVSPRHAKRFRELIAGRAAGVPVAHLTGFREFHSLALRVSPATLVPRPETELLVQQVLERLSVDARATVLDAGTGCGALALAIKHRRPGCRVVGVDCSDAALEVAAGNSTRLGLEVHWIRSNWFDGLTSARYNLVAANPPYVRRDDAALVSGDLRHEPRLALDGGVDGLDSLRTIIASAPRVLAAGGVLLLEHGCDQARSVRNLLDRRGFVEIETHCDLAGRDRVTLGRLP